MKLKASTDRKTANLSSPNGKTAKIANAFGLPAGSDYSCPGMTSVCQGVCYANKLERLFKGMRDVMLHNWDIVISVRGRTLVRLLDEMITEFEAQCDKWNAEKLFRIHHDGDFFSLRYANAWKNVMLSHPNVQFWAYTRSFHLVSALADIDNFTLYLSVDSENVNGAVNTYRANPWVKLAAMGKTFNDAKDLLAAMGAKGARCPELNGAIPLITVNGGACKTCGLCIAGRNNVTFSTSKK